MAIERVTAGPNGWSRWIPINAYDEGEGVEGHLRQICCDCGLAHDYLFRISPAGELQFKTARNERSTAQIRRRRSQAIPA